MTSINPSLQAQILERLTRLEGGVETLLTKLEERLGRIEDRIDYIARDADQMVALVSKQADANSRGIARLDERVDEVLLQQKDHEKEAIHSGSAQRIDDFEKRLRVIEEVIHETKGRSEWPDRIRSAMAVSVIGGIVTLIIWVIQNS